MRARILEPLGSRALLEEVHHCIRNELLESILYRVFIKLTKKSLIS